MSEPKKNEDSSAGLEIDAATDPLSNIPPDLIRDIEVDLKSALPEKQQKEVIKVVRQVVESKAAYFSGPQPPPDLIAEYERIAPGWGIKILEMGEREQLHRHACDREILKRGDRELDLDRDWLIYAKRGLNFGFVAFILIGLVGVCALYLHEAVVAGICFGTTAIGVIANFVKGPGQRNSAAKTTDESDSEQDS